MSTYCMIPITYLTREMLVESTTPNLDDARITPEGRIVLHYRNAPPSSATRFVTRDREGASDWLDSRPVPESMKGYIDAITQQLRVARNILEENSRTP